MPAKGNYNVFNKDSEEVPSLAAAAPPAPAAAAAPKAPAAPAPEEQPRARGLSTAERIKAMEAKKQEAQEAAAADKPKPRSTTPLPFVFPCA